MPADPASIADGCTRPSSGQRCVSVRDRLKGTGFGETGNWHNAPLLPRKASGGIQFVFSDASNFIGHKTFLRTEGLALSAELLSVTAVTFALAETLPAKADWGEAPRGGKDQSNKF